MDLIDRLYSVPPSAWDIWGVGCDPGADTRRESRW